jgi:hypothetical protein
MRQADRKMVDKILTDIKMADDDDDEDFSRDVWIGGGIVAPSDVSVANGYSATEELLKKCLFILFSKRIYKYIYLFT